MENKSAVNDALSDYGVSIWYNAKCGFGYDTQFATSLSSLITMRIGVGMKKLIKMLSVCRKVRKMKPMM